MLVLRPFQSEDVAAVIAAHATYRSVLGRAATGLGKAVELAAIAQHYSKSGRVMVLVDVKKLVRQLAATITRTVGIPPGIEMGDEVSATGHFYAADQIVVSTVQTQYSGDIAAERYRKFNPDDFSALLLDECELYVAPKAREVVNWYMQNRKLKVCGMTATPFRTDGIGMANLFEHVAFNRDILWGIKEGYLVGVKQAFVRVSVDFSTLKLRKNDDGESDYSEAEIAEKISSEQTLIELAKGIATVAGDRKSIVVAPDVESARAIAHYLEAERPGCARCVYGELGDEEKEANMDGHRRNEFQFLTSVMMLTKGYDDPSIRAVFNCRKTKSKRLYQQILGRGTRPHFSIVDAINAATTANERRSIIAGSCKPDALMVNMVGLGEAVRDMTVLDILGEVEDPTVLERAKEIIGENDEIGPDAAIMQAEAEIELDRDVEQVRAEEAAAAADEIDEQQAIRRLVQVEASVDVEYQDDLRVGGGEFGPTLIPDKQMAIFRKAKLSDKEIAKLKPEAAARLCQEIIGWWRTSAGCTYKQGRILRRSGYPAVEILAMTFEAASGEIDAIAKNNWRRPAGVGA